MCEPIVRLLVTSLLFLTMFLAVSLVYAIFTRLANKVSSVALIAGLSVAICLLILLFEVLVRQTLVVLHG